MTLARLAASVMLISGFLKIGDLKLSTAVILFVALKNLKPQITRLFQY